MSSLEDRRPPVVPSTAHIAPAQPSQPQPSSSYGAPSSRSHSKRRKHTRHASAPPPTVPSGYGGGMPGGTPYAFASPHLAPDDSISAAPTPGAPLYAAFAVPHAGPYHPPTPNPEPMRAQLQPQAQEWGWDSGGGGGAPAWDDGRGGGGGWNDGRDGRGAWGSPASGSYSSLSQSVRSGFVPSPLAHDGAMPALLATPGPYPGTPSPNPYPSPPPSLHAYQQQQQGYFPTSYPPAAQLYPPPHPAAGPYEQPPLYEPGHRDGKTQRKLDTISRSPGDFKDVADRRFFDRPGSWRPDFRMPRSGLEAVFKKKGKTFSRAIQEKHPSELSPKLRYLSFPTTHAPITWDLRLPPTTEPGAPTAFTFAALQSRPPTHYDVQAFATEPPVPVMRLYHARLPWYVDVIAADPVGITIRDVLDGIWGVLSARVRTADYLNSEVEDEERRRIDAAYAARCGPDAQQRAAGVKRVDFLMRDCIFLGLSRGREGMYEMRTRKVA